MRFSSSATVKSRARSSADDDISQTPEGAEQLARKLHAESAPGDAEWKDVPVFLDSLRSSTVARLDGKRRTAIRDFWTTYFDLRKARSFFATDGPGESEHFLIQALGDS